ncbi:MAG: acyl-CoA dehydrogenase family protein, partial [Gammaproteobacteria bacterium]|nr:acyl-CoA dehydrogenase family protein [Gammaproteobacteria bacterium]
VRRIAEEAIAPRAQHYDKSAEFPWDNVEALRAIGLNAVFVPEDYDGAPLSYAAYLESVKIISAACAATGIIYATNFHGMKPLIDFGTHEQKQRLLPCIAHGGLASLVITEPAAGSDATQMTTRFEPVGDDIVINGTKTFITSGDVADRLLLFGKWSTIDDARGAISALIVEKGVAGLSVERLEDKMGIRASSTATLRFEDCRVPRANLLGEPGDGLKILLSSLNKSRPSIAAHALGIARAAFDEMVRYINQREQFGRAVLDFQGNQFIVADLAAELAMCEAWVDHVAALIDSGAPAYGVEASIAKLRASDLAMKMTVEAVQMHGGYGFIKDYPVERLMRDAKITQIWEGTNQLHRQFIGRSFRTR